MPRSVSAEVIARRTSSIRPQAVHGLQEGRGSRYGEHLQQRSGLALVDLLAVADGLLQSSERPCSLSALGEAPHDLVPWSATSRMTASSQRVAVRRQHGRRGTDLGERARGTRRAGSRSAASASLRRSGTSAFVSASGRSRPHPRSP